MNAKRKGWRREDQARKQLEKEGYYVTRSGGSLGLWDLIAIRGTCWPGINCPPIRLIQVKSNRPPRPKEMQRLRAFLVPRMVTREVWIYPDRKPVRVEVL